MQLLYKEVEHVLASHFGIPEERRSAFRARIQNLQRGGVPGGVNTGKGKRATYGWPQLVELIVALDIIDVGVSPDATISIVGGMRNHLMRAAAHMGQDVSTSVFQRWVSEEQAPASDMLIVGVSTRSIQRLGADVAPAGFIMTCDDFASTLADEYPFEPAICIVHLGKRLLTLINFLHILAIADLDLERATQKVIGSFREWFGTIELDDPL